MAVREAPSKTSVKMAAQGIGTRTLVLLCRMWGFPLISVPSEGEKVSLPLSGPQGHQQGQGKSRGSHLKEAADVLLGPSLILSFGFVSRPPRSQTLPVSLPRSLPNDSTRLSAVQR